MSGKKAACDLGAKTINLANYACGGGGPRTTGSASKALVMAEACHPCLPRGPVPCTPEQAAAALRPAPPPVPSCADVTPAPPACPPAQPVRVCGPRDVRRLCPPPVCPCPAAEPALTPGARVAHLLGLAVRAAAVVGLVAYTDGQGLWGGQEDAARLYGRAALRIADVAHLDLPAGQLPPVPVIHDLVRAAGLLWNRAVTLAFDAVMLLPAALGGVDSADSGTAKDDKESLCSGESCKTK